MSFLTPTSNGLAVAPNAAGDANNPAASVQELQQPQFWGRFSLLTQLPNVGTVDGAAVVGVNAAANPAYSKMRPGDVAFVQATNQVYWLQSRGTLSGSDAVWVSYVVPPIPSATATNAAPFNLTGAIGRLYIDNSLGAVTINLPNPALYANRQWYLEITSSTLNPATLTRFGAEQIMGAAQNRILRAALGSWILICDGTNWWLEGQNRLELIYTASDTLTVEAGWTTSDVTLRAGAGGGGAGGTGGAGANGTGGGGGGKGGAGGGSALSFNRFLVLPAPGTVLTLTVGAGGTGGAGAGGNGSPTEIFVGAAALLRTSRTNPAQGGGGGGAGGAGNPGVGASGGSAGTGGTGGPTLPTWSANGNASSAAGAGGSGTAGANATSTSTTTASRPGPWAAAFTQVATSGQGGALGGGTHGGGGGGSGGGSGAIGDDFSPVGLASTASDGAGGGRLTTEGNGGAGNSAGVGSPGVAGNAGFAGTNGRGGGGGQGGGGGGSGSAGGGAGGVGGAGGNGSGGLIVITVWD